MNKYYYNESCNYVKRFREGGSRSLVYIFSFNLYS